MKNKILCFIYAVVLPLIFVLVGCNNTPPPADPPPAPLTLTTVLNQFENKTQPTNFTLAGNLGLVVNVYTYQNNQVVDTAKVTYKNEGISLKYDNQNYSFIYPGDYAKTIYSVDGKTYTKVNPKDFNSNNFDLNYTHQQNSIANFLTTKDVLNSVVTVSNFFTKNSVSVEETNSQIILNCNFSLKQTFNGLLDIIKNNINKELHFAITDTINTLFSANINFLDCVNEFKNSFNDNTTINDFIIFLSNKVKHDTAPTLEFLYNIAGNFIPNRTTKSNLIQTNSNVSLETIKESILNLSFTEFKNLKITELVSTDEGESKDIIFDKIFHYINNPTYTVEYALNKVAKLNNLNLQNIINNITNYSISSGNAIIKIAMDKNYNIVSMLFTCNIDVLELDEDKNGKKYSFNISGDCIVNNYNSTTVNLPSSITIENVSYSLDINTNQISLQNQDYIIDCSDLQNVANFEFGVQIWDNQTMQYKEQQNFVSYNNQTKQLTLNQQVLNLILSSNINLITIVGTNFTISIYLI